MASDVGDAGAAVTKDDERKGFMSEYLKADPGTTAAPGIPPRGPLSLRTWRAQGPTKW